MLTKVISYLISPEIDQTETEPTYATNSLTFAEFQLVKSSPSSQPLTFATFLKTYCTHLAATEKEGEYYCLWVEFQEKKLPGFEDVPSLYLRFEAKEYESQCVKTTGSPELDQYLGTGTANYMLEAFEWDPEYPEQCSNRLIKVQLSTISELLWVNKGTHFSGTELMTFIEDFFNTTNLKLLILLDESELKFKIASTPARERKTKTRCEEILLNIRVLFSIANGASWYAKRGAEATTINNWTGPNGEIITQNSAILTAAIDHLRTMTNQTLHQLLKNNTSETANIFENLLTRYNAINLNLGQLVGLLLKLNNTASRPSNSAELSSFLVSARQILLDLEFLQNNVLLPQPHQAHWKNDILWFNLLKEIVNQHQVFVFDFEKLALPQDTQEEAPIFDLTKRINETDCPTKWTSLV